MSADTLCRGRHQELEMTAEQIAFWDYERDAPVTCPACGWTGPASDGEDVHRELLDVCCPQCDRMVLIIPFPTIEETRAAAADGNPRAAAELPEAEAVASRALRAQQLELREAAQLPDISEAEVRIDWDLEEQGDEQWTVLRHQGAEIWRELAYYEGYERFVQVFHILCERYGSRLKGVRPTHESETYLYGDRLSAPDTVSKLNAGLAEDGGIGDGPRTIMTGDSA